MKEACHYFALPGNHDYYSGGYGYFDGILPALGQEANYFNLRALRSSGTRTPLRDPGRSPGHQSAVHWARQYPVQRSVLARQRFQKSRLRKSMNDSPRMRTGLAITASLYCNLTAVLLMSHISTNTEENSMRNVSNSAAPILWRSANF